MLQEAMEVFQIMLQEKGERIITDAYIPKDLSVNCNER